MKCQLVSVLVIAALPSMISAVTIRVPSDQPTIQAAIGAAVTKDTILLADGIYTGTGNRNIDMGGKKVVIRSENGPAVTIIDCQGSLATPYRGFNFHSKEDTTAKLEGITITNGFGLHDTPGGFTVGGAIRCDTSSKPLLRNCVIYGNTAQRGGGVYSGYLSYPKMYDCVIRKNSAVFGGGLGVFTAYGGFRRCLIDSNSADTGAGWGGNDMIMYVYSSSIVANHATKKGGGAAVRQITLMVMDSCTVTDNQCFHPHPPSSAGIAGGVAIEDVNRSYFSSISNTLFARNSSEYAGGLMVDSSSHLIVRHCRFVSDSALGAGGAIGTSGSIRIDSCTFEECWGWNIEVGYGGAIQAGMGMSGTIDSCTFLNNHTIWNGGAMLLTDGASPHITNCYFEGNEAIADVGGGIAMDLNCNPVIDSCLFVHQKNGALFAITTCAPQLKNCTIVGTTGRDSLKSAAIWFWNDYHPVIDNTIIANSDGPSIRWSYDSYGHPPDPFSMAHISCSDFYGNKGGDWPDSIASQQLLRGNMSADPRFCDTLTHKFTINMGSPCAPPNNSCGALIGALPVGCCCQGMTGDINVNGAVDLADLSYLVSYLTGGVSSLPCPTEGNTNGVGTVDLADLSLLVSFLTGGGGLPVYCP
jgi:hypothetical protein